MRSYGADWRVQEPRTSLDVAVRYVSYDYPFGASNSGNNGLPTTTLPTNNSDFKLASVLLARQLTPTLNWDVGVYFQHQDIVDAPAVERHRRRSPTCAGVSVSGSGCASFTHTIH